MDLKLLDLRRYAIDKRVEIRFAVSDSGRQCLINNKGQVKIPAEGKDFRVDDVLAVAQSFDVTGHGKPVRLTREAMAQALSEAFNRRGIDAVSKEEE